MKRNYSVLSNIFFSLKMFFSRKKIYFLIVSFLIMLSVIVPLIEILFPPFIVNIISTQKEFNYFLMIILLLLLFYALLNFALIKVKNYFDVELIIARLDDGFMKLIDKMVNSDYQNIEPAGKQNLSARATQAISSNDTGIEGIVHEIPNFFVCLIMLSIFSFFLFSVHYLIICILFGMVILNLFFSYLARCYEKKLKPAMGNSYKESEYLYDSSISITNAKDIRAYNLSDWLYRLYKLANKKLFINRLKVISVSSLSDVSDSIFLMFRDLLAYSLLAKMYLVDQSLNLTEFVLYLAMITSLSNFINQLVNSINTIAVCSIPISDYRQFLNTKDLLNHGSGIIPTKFPLDIEFRNVTFAYPDTKDKIFDNFSLKIEGGKKVAIVGINGAGKSTFVKLLAGLYCPDEGQILLGGIPINKINVSDLHSLISVIFQDVKIFGITILENITCCNRLNSNIKKVEQCLELAGLKEDISNLEDGLNTYLTQNLSDNGILLSGGQMQKLALARALYKQAPLLILDEPTAALDPIAESQLYQKYNQLTLDKTSIFISHRLSSTRFCDEIIFLKNGKVIQRGNHLELMSEDGEYSQMFQVQAQYYLKEKEEKENEELFS